MASFTDNIQALSTFTPYVQQLPVEAMVKVGMQKQEQYNQGVQKIQTAIDNIAGLDIAKDADKAYLQSKINELGNNLKFVAAGDFSDFQLVNSVNGMTGQIVKDTNVQNAVASTARLRKEQQYKEEARKAGKSSVQNDWYFNNGVNDYLNSSTIGESFTGKYVDYTDIDKKLRDVADKIKEVDNTVDNPYMRDHEGNTLYFDSKGNVSTDVSKGTPKLDLDMLSTNVKGKPAEKILANFYDSLSENDMQQLRIDASYHYRGSTADTFKADITKNYNNQKQILSDSIVNKNLELSTNPKLTQSQKDKLKADIVDLNEQMSNGSLEKEFAKQIEQIDSNTDIENYKYKIYTQKTLTNLAKDISVMSYKQERKSNPAMQMLMERKKLDFDYWNAKRQQDNEDRTFNFGVLKWNTEQAQKELDKKGPKVATRDVALPTDVSVSKLDDEIKGLVEYDNTGKLIGGQLRVLNNKYIPLLTDSSKFKNNEQKEKYLTELSDKYSTNPASLSQLTKDPNIRKYLIQRRNLEIEIAQKQNLKKGVYNNVTKEYNKKVNDVISQEQGVADANGRQLYSAKDLLDFKQASAAYYKVYNTSQEPGQIVGGLGPAGPSVVLVGKEKLLQKYKGTRFEALARALVAKESGSPISSTGVALLNNMDRVYKNVSSKTNKIYAERKQKENDYLAQHSPQTQAKEGTLNYNDKINNANINNFIGNKLSEYQDLGSLDIDKPADFNEKTLSELRKGKNTSYVIRKNFDGSGELRIIGSGGGSVQRLPMTAKEMKDNFPNVAISNPMDEIKNRVLISPNKTTNITDSQSGTNAFLTGEYSPYLAKNSYLSSIVRYDVEGSPDNNGDDSNDGYSLRMYVNNNGTWISQLLNTEYKSLAQIQEMIRQVGPGTVDQVLKINK
jgi:hypothetical protein